MKKRKIRLWPALGILLLNALATGWIWLFWDESGQKKVIGTIATELISIILLCIWLLFLSRLAWRKRLTIFTSVVLGIGLFVAAFRFTEVSGDLIPIFEPRWRSEVLVPAARAVKQNAASFSDATENEFNYAQFLGPDRNAVITNIKLQKNWRKYPPKLLWKQPIGDGWSAFAVHNNRAVTQEQHGENEAVVCYELLTGKVLWTHHDRTRYQTVLGGVGPRATPTITGNRVYALGAHGRLNCLNLTTGALIWGKNILKENNAKLPEWGVAGSPLLVDSLVVVSAGGPAGRSLVAYDRESGDIVWAGGNDRAHYSSPLHTTIAGTPQIVIFTYENVNGHSLADGKILWQFPWPQGTQKVAQPVVLDNDLVLISTGYGIGSKLIRVTKESANRFKTKLIWESIRLKAKFANMVHKDGYIYGLDDGILTCMAVKTGKRKWKRGRYGHGQLILVDDVLLITTEAGEMALVEASPDAYNELAFVPAIEGKTWNNPALAGKHLLVRNGQEAACFELTLSN